MTKEQKLRRNRFATDFDEMEEGFVLADLDLMLDEIEPQPVPLNPFPDDDDIDDDIIDRLLITANHKAEDKLGHITGDYNFNEIEDINLSYQFTDFDEFVVEPIGKEQIETEEFQLSNFQDQHDFEEVPKAEDAIDRLLVNTGFDGNIKLEEVEVIPDGLEIDDISLTDEFPESDKFVVGPVELTGNKRYVESEENSETDIHLVIDPDEIANARETIDRFIVSSKENAIDKLFAANGVEAYKKLNENIGTTDTLPIEDVRTGNKPRVNFEGQGTTTSGHVILESYESKVTFDNDTSDVLMKKDTFESENRQQSMSHINYPNEDLELINNEAAMITQRPIKSEHDITKNQIQGTEEKVNNISAITYISLVFAIIALSSSVIMGILLFSMQTKISKLTELVSILEEDMSSIADKDSDLEINNSNPSSERLDQKVNGLPKQHENQILSPSDNTEMKITGDMTKKNTSNKSLDNLQSKFSISDKEKPLETVKKIPPETKFIKMQSPTEWSVNLTAYEDLSYAKSKAAKYIQKGIPVKVIEIDMNHTTWYRLRVGGFKNKEEATSYADKIKRSVNLSSVSVINN